MNITGIIYKYTSPSGKHYIEQTTDEKNRKYQHKTQTIKTDTKFGQALKKYGFENFVYEVLWTTTGEYKSVSRALNTMETAYINKYNSWKNGYNSTLGGDNPIRQDPEITSKNKRIRYNKWEESYNKYMDREEDEYIKYDRDWEHPEWVNIQDRKEVSTYY